LDSEADLGANALIKDNLKVYVSNPWEEACNCLIKLLKYKDLSRPDNYDDIYKLKNGIK